MSYIENPFKVGQYAKCINDNFPEIITTKVDKSSLGKQPSKHPKLGKYYVVDEILGEFVRFDEFDCSNENSIDYGYKWWHHNRFQALTDEEFENEYENIEYLYN